MYVFVENNGEIPVAGIRLLGLSNKSKDKIGQFGTGLKESIALFLRLNCEIIIFSGLTRFDFKIIQTDSEPAEICFKISEKFGKFETNQWHGLGMSPNFGKLDWNSYWQALREVFCNAYDEGGLKHDLTATLSGQPGKTKVFISGPKELIHEYTKIEHKLLFLERKVQLKNHIIEKAEISQATIYSKGVWIQESYKKSIFDFEITSLKLSESRSADWNTIYYDIGGIYSAAEISELVQLFKIAERSDFKDFIESDLFSYFFIPTVENCMTWKDAWIKTYGLKAVAISQDGSAEHFNILARRGFRPVVLADSFFKILRVMKIPVAENFLDKVELGGNRKLETSSDFQQSFDVIWTKLEKYKVFGGFKKPRFCVFESLNGVKGYAENNSIFISSDILNSDDGEKEIIRQLVSHFSGGESDSFQESLLTITQRILKAI